MLLKASAAAPVDAVTADGGCDAGGEDPSGRYPTGIVEDAKVTGTLLAEGGAGGAEAYSERLSPLRGEGTAEVWPERGRAPAS